MEVVPFTMQQRERRVKEAISVDGTKGINGIPPSSLQTKQKLGTE